MLLFIFKYFCSWRYFIFHDIFLLLFSTFHLHICHWKLVNPYWLVVHSGVLFVTRDWKSVAVCQQLILMVHLQPWKTCCVSLVLFHQHLKLSCELCFFPLLSLSLFYHDFCTTKALKGMPSHCSQHRLALWISVHTRADMPHRSGLSNRACFHGDHLSPLLCYFMLAERTIQTVTGPETEQNNAKKWTICLSKFMYSFETGCARVCC